MEHSTFIIAAYGATGIILAWCAIAPLLRATKLKAQLTAASLRSKSDKNAP
jgi:heme exporter protein CcmD